MASALESLPPVVATFLLVFLTTTLCRIVRSIIRTVLKDDLAIYQYIAEAISTFQLVAGMMEGDIVLEEYGTTCYGIYLWLFFMTLGFTFDGDSTANSCSIWHSVLVRRCTRTKGILKVVMQILGGQLAFPYVKFLWSVSPMLKHGIKWSSLLTLHCQSALKVTILEGCFAEALATYFYFFVMSFKPEGRWSTAAMDATVQVMIILTGLEWTGMMFNPALATALTFNCVNHPLIDHIMVYWIAPLTVVPLAEASFGEVERQRKRRKEHQFDKEA